MKNGQKDRHVLAAAVRERAEVNVTTNVKDFPEDALKPYQIKVVDPDDFLLDQLDLYEDATRAVIEGMVDAYTNPSFAPHKLLDALATQVPRFAAESRRLFPPTGLLCKVIDNGPVTAKRMDREQFFGVVSGLDQDRLRKVLWNVYWRGTASMRERIEAELADGDRVGPRRTVKAPVDPETVRDEVVDFVALARSGAYLGRDRRVSPRERTRWRLTFKRLATDAQDALRAEDAAPAASAVEQLVDLACDTRDYDYFRSEDPMSAAGFVVSDVAAVLWTSLWERHGFQVFAETAAPQLIRWESRYGWTRRGEGAVVAQETSLAEVLARMLHVPDTWERFVEEYVRALDALRDRAASKSSVRGFDQRSDALAQWHGLLLTNLTADEGGLLDIVAAHAALGGPEQMFFTARLAHRRGSTDTARKLMERCLRKLPGHREFREFAAEIGTAGPQ